jgi:AcrR family transcriptional regulator
MRETEPMDSTDATKTEADPRSAPRATRRSDAELNDARILGAAIALTERRGSIPSISAVAREAQVGTTTVYRRFDSLQALQGRASAALVCGHLGPAMEAALTDARPMRAFRALSLALIDEVRSLPPEVVSLTDLMEEYLSRFLPAISALKTSAQQAGDLRPDITVDDIAGITVAMLAGITEAQPWISSPDRYVALLFDGLSRTDAPALPEP